jgi:hypothetical protein
MKLMQHNKPAVLPDKFFSSLYSYLSEDWDSTVAQAGNEIVNHILKTPSSYLEQIQFASFKRIIKTEISDHELKSLLNYFCGNRAQLLEYHFAIIEEDSVTTITNEQLAEADKIGSFYHPYTGEVIDNYESKIFVMYDLTHKLRQLKINL